MCQLCNGTRVIYEEGSYYGRICGCPHCTPVSDEEWNAGIITLKNWVEEMKIINLVGSYETNG